MRASNAKLLLNTFTSLLFFSLFPAATLARSVDAPAINLKQNAWFVGAGGGVAWSGFSSSTSVLNGMVAPAPFNSDKFSIDSPTMGVFQVEVGYISYIVRKYFPVLSAYLQYRHYFSANITGNIEQYSLPEFENYSYQMTYEADLFTINGKAGLFQFKQVIPYLSGGVGFIINHMNDYSESPKPNVTPRVSPAYQGNSETNLAATLGAGLDFIVNHQTTVTLGYDHLFQGNTKSGSGESTWSNTLLNFGNTKMDTVFINVAYNFAPA